MGRRETSVTVLRSADRPLVLALVSILGAGCVSARRAGAGSTGDVSACDCCDKDGDRDPSSAALPVRCTLTEAELEARQGVRSLRRHSARLNIAPSWGRGAFS